MAQGPRFSDTPIVAALTCNATRSAMPAIGGRRLNVRVNRVMDMAFHVSRHGGADRDRPENTQVFVNHRFNGTPGRGHAAAMPVSLCGGQRAIYQWEPCKSCRTSL